MARRIEVELVGDSRSLERAFARSERSAKKFQGSMTKIGKLGRLGGAAGLLGGVGLVAGIEKSAMAASDLEEQMSKTNVVFGDSADTIKDWSKTTSDAFGLSRRQALGTASSFGALFAPLGIVGRESAEQARKLTELGADLASFYNTDVQDALDAIRSGLVGESEPLRRYGVLLSETRVQQEAMSETGKKNAKSLTAQEKALARVALIFKDTTNAQGDFARTSEGTANKLRVFKANVDDLQVALGKDLLPIITAVIGALNKLFDIKGPSLVDIVQKGGTHLGSESRFTRGGVFVGGRGGAKPKLGPPAPPGPIPNLFAGALKALNEFARRAEKVRADLAKPISKGQQNAWFDARLARQLDRIQDLSLRKQLARLKAIAQEVKARLAVTTDATRRLTLEDELLGIYREQRSVQEQITDQIKAANQALKDRADAIKSAIIERLQRKQTDILNKRALQDAKEALAIALRLGGPKGIRAGRRGVADVRADMRIAALERAPATLTRGGRFALGNIVTININGVTDPEAVANRVATVLKRRQKHSGVQTRGQNAGARAG